MPVEELEEFTEVYNMLSRWNENGYFGDISYPTFQTAANYGAACKLFYKHKGHGLQKRYSDDADRPRI